MHPRNLSISDFSYLLPEERIARFPLAERDQSKLLVYKNRLISESTYRDIATELPANALLIFNNTKVIEARIYFQKASGGIIEIFTLEPADTYPDITTAMQQKGSVCWKCLIGGASKWKHGQVLQKKINNANREIIVEAKIKERFSDSFLIEFSWNQEELTFSEILHLMGNIPIPPYLKRETEKNDLVRYQTIYAANEGSVASPTAGLHFTETIFHDFKEKNIDTAFVTLHVGAGTFMPVKAQLMRDHKMHAEFIEVDISLVENLAKNIADIFAVGTTSLRTIESLYWMGAKCLLHRGITLHDLELQQWEVYEELAEMAIDRGEALGALKKFMNAQQLSRLIVKTHLLIAPGYRFRIASGLITNFHQPNSTLLLLVAAMIGDDWKNVYEYALKNEFRFLSYGDGCLLYARDRI